LTLSEVGSIVNDETEKRFISGIFNYCDRWCERCRFGDRCRVHYEEQKRLERHLLRGEDPDDPRVVMADVSESFGETLGMLHEMADEMGLDLNNMEEEPEEEEFSPHDHPLFQRATRWSGRVDALLRMVYAELPDHRPLDEAPEREAAAVSAEVLDAVEVLTQYQYFIPVKTARALDGWMEAERGRRPYPEFSRENAHGTAKLVHLCLGRCVEALRQLAAYSAAWREMAEPIAEEATALQGAVDLQFPGHQAFRRPGFDDPEA
jgi:hypothetical protein